MVTLERIFGHDRWATLALIDALVALPASTLDLAAPGTYGAIGPTLAHLVGAHERYLQRLAGGVLPPPSPDPEVVGPEDLANLRVRAALACDGLRLEAERRAGGEIVEGVRGGIPFALPVWLFLAQAIHHGNEHRAHVATVLGTHGLPVPDLDVWTFEEVVGAHPAG